MLNTALKEWQIVCDLLASGELAILLRKGGIAERSGPGVFELDHDRFLLLPSWAHQKPEMLKPAYRDRVERRDEPTEITFAAWAEATRIWQVPSRERFDSLDDLHPWSLRQIDMRFDYKPENPLYLVALRTRRLAEPVTIPTAPSYYGCLSWITLTDDQTIDPTGEPVLDDSAFDSMVDRIDSALS